MEQSYCGYVFRYCSVCRKECFHFLLKGDGCRVYVCRNYEHHRKATRSITDILKEIDNQFPTLKGEDNARTSVE